MTLGKRHRWIVMSPRLLGCVIFLFILTLTVISPGLKIHACSMHGVDSPQRFPTDKELEDAVEVFINEYYSYPGRKYAGYKIEIIDTWHVKMHNPEQVTYYGPVIPIAYNVLLGYKELIGLPDGDLLEYSLTFIAYEHEKGFFFWPYAAKSFSSRDELEQYVEDKFFSTSSKYNFIRGFPDLSPESAQRRTLTLNFKVIFLFTAGSFLLYILVLRGRFVKKVKINHRR